MALFVWTAYLRASRARGGGSPHALKRHGIELPGVIEGPLTMATAQPLGRYGTVRTFIGVERVASFATIPEFRGRKRQRPDTICPALDPDVRRSPDSLPNMTCHRVAYDYGTAIFPDIPSAGHCGRRTKTFRRFCPL